MTPFKGVIFIIKIFQKPLDRIRIMFYNMNVRLREKERNKERGNEND